MKIKLLVVKSALEVTKFVDFLEDIPQKTVKIVIKATFVTAICTFLLFLLFVELRSEALSNFLSFLLVPKSRLSLTSSSTPSPRRISNKPFPEINAKSILVYDVTHNVSLYKREASAALPPASTTKLMTALVAMDIFTMDQKLFVPKDCTELDSQSIGLIFGEAITVRDLLYSMLVGSSGDSACTLAYGGESYGQFIGLMNKKAQDKGLLKSSFTNPIGLDDSLGGHYSSAEDLLLLSLEVIKDPFLQNVVRTKEYQMTSGFEKRMVFSTNELLWNLEGTVGIKTGTTPEAGEVLIFEYQKGSADLIIIIMGSEKRFIDTKAILNWVLESYAF